MQHISLEHELHRIPTFCCLFLRSNIKHYATSYDIVGRAVVVFLGLSFYRRSSTERSKEASHKSSFMCVHDTSASHRKSALFSMSDSVSEMPASQQLSVLHVINVAFITF